MKSSKTKLSAFAQSAIDLDADFQELETLGRQLQGLDVESDFGLDQARKILGKFGECGNRIGDGVQQLAKSLNESRELAEATARMVAERAALVEAFHLKQQTLLSRFQILGDTVKQVTESIGQLKSTTSGTLSPEEKTQIEKHIPELNSSLGMLIDQARSLKEDAQASKLKTLEKNAHALSQALHSAQNKLSGFLKP